jgi:hypothetical protein
MLDLTLLLHVPKDIRHANKSFLEKAFDGYFPLNAYYQRG